MTTRIDFVRSGGLAGLSLAASVDASTLDPEAAAAVRDALDRVDLGALSQQGRRAPSAPDRFQYDITVTTDDGRSQTVTLEESDVPGELRPLIDALMPLARPRP